MFNPKLLLYYCIS